MSNLSGWYSYIPGGQGINFAGNGQAILFGRNHQGKRDWLVLQNKGDRWDASVEDGHNEDGSVKLTPAGSLKIIEQANGSLIVVDSLDPVALGDTGFSPLPPPLFNGVLTKLL